MLNEQSGFRCEMGGNLMLNQVSFKSLLRKNKALKVMEFKNWADELDENIDFGYFTYYAKNHTFHHIMMIVVYLENEIQIEYIQQPKETEETKEIIAKIQEVVMAEIKNNSEYAQHAIHPNIDRERFKKYLLADERLQKKMERYIKE